MLILGLAKGALDVGCNTLLLWVHNDTVGPFMNGLHAFFGVGSFIAPLIVAQVIAVTNDINWVYWFFAIASFPIAIWIWNLPSPVARVVPARHENAPFPIIPVIIMVLCFVLYVGGEAGYGAWIYTYAFTLKFGTEVTAAYLTSAFWGSFTLGRLLGIWVSMRARSITILAIDFAGCLVSLALILFFNRFSHPFVDWDNPVWHLPSLHLPYISNPGGRAHAHHRYDHRLVPRWSRIGRHDPAAG